MISIPLYIEQCAASSAPMVMQAIVKTESNGNPLAIGLNKGYSLKYPAKTETQARKWVEYLEQNNYNFDVGLGQINIKNIHKYGYKAADVLDPCINLKIAGAILNNNYQVAKSSSKTTELALKRAISAYNTGNYTQGFTNGYVSKVLANTTLLAKADVPPIVAKPNDLPEVKAKPQEPRSSKTVLFAQPHRSA